MGDVYGVYSWAVRTYECGPDGRATMVSVCNWLQEAASLNAETLAFSKSDFEARSQSSRSRAAGGGSWPTAISS